MVFIPLAGLFIIVLTIVVGANLTPSSPPPRHKSKALKGGGGGQYF